MSRAMIHLGVHNHFVVDGKCRELVEEIRKLIIEEVDRTPDVKISSISFNASKTLASYLLDDFGNGIVEVFKGEQLEHIQNKLCELSFPNVHNLVVFFKRHLGGGYIDSIFQLKSKSRYDYI
jgi:hypothetical protein